MVSDERKRKACGRGGGAITGQTEEINGNHGVDLGNRESSSTHILEQAHMYTVPLT